jgi:transcriptional regulator with XRE-family HTH domain
MVVAQRWTGLEAAALRQARRMSVRAYAAHLGVSAATVANWDNRGELARLNTETQQMLDIDLERAPDDVQQRFTSALASESRGLTDGTSAEGPANQTEVTVEAEVPWQLPTELLDGVVPNLALPMDPNGGDDVDLAATHIRRRTLLRGLAMVAAAAGIVGAGRGPRRRIGITEVSQLTALTSLYRLADQEFGGGSLVDDVGQFAESASALLDHMVSDTLRPQLLVAIANARDLAGWTAFDATRHSDAQRHFAAAERSAIDARDRQLVAHIRYGQAKQMQHLRHNRDALDILRTAHHKLDATPALTTILRGAEAASQAAIGDWDGAKQALEQSSNAFADVNPGKEPEWLGFFDKGELLAQYGRVYRDWARADRRRGDDAVRWVTEAIDAFGPQNIRSTVLNQIGLASAYFLADAPDLALQAGKIAQREAATLTSPRVIERIANLRRDASQHLHLPEVAEFVRTLPRPAPTA